MNSYKKIYEKIIDEKYSSSTFHAKCSIVIMKFFFEFYGRTSTQ